MPAGHTRILALRRKGTAARSSDRCRLRAAGKPNAEPKANVGFSSPHGNCFGQFKSNFVKIFVNLFQNRLDPSERSLFQNAPQAKPRFCAAGHNSRIPALRRKGTAARGSDRCQMRAAGKPNAEPKANVGFSSPHGNCFWQYKSNFVNLFQNAPQAKPRFCAAGLNSCPQGIRAYLRSGGKVQRRAALIVAKCAPQENRTQSRRRTLGFPLLTEIAFGNTKAIS